MGGRARSLAVLCVVMLAAQAVPAAEVADRFDCRDCHVKRLREFRNKEIRTLIPYDPKPVTETGAQDDASTPVMCFSCHDGFVMDSRALWKEGHRGHPIGVYPPPQMQIPEVDGVPEFPLNDDGKLYCGTCHWAHEGEGAAAGAPSFLRVSSADGNLCQACHADKATVSDSPHASSSRKAREARDYSDRGVCRRCHTPHQAQGPVLWARTPGQANTAVSTLCRSCHGKDPALGEHPVQVVAWSQALREGIRTGSGVAMPVFDEQARSASVGAIGCATCHDVHRHDAAGENGPGLFLRQAQTAEFLCADCHAQASLYRYQYFHTAGGRRGKL